MTEATPLENDGDSIIASDERRKIVTLRRWYSEHAITKPLQFVGFWAAVALPFLYVPLLFDGLSGTKSTVFLALLALNVLALFAGHSYKRE